MLVKTHFLGEFNISKVVLRIMETKPTLLPHHVSKKMRLVDTPAQLQCDIKKNVKIGQTQIYDALEEVLHEWLGRKSQGATIEKFMQHLERCQLKSHADEIAKVLINQSVSPTGIQQTSYSDNGPDIHPTSSTPMIDVSADVESGTKKCASNQSHNRAKVTIKSNIAKILLLSFLFICISSVAVIVHQKDVLFGKTFSDEPNSSELTLVLSVKNPTALLNGNKSLGRCTNGSEVTKLLVSSYIDFERHFSLLNKHCQQFSLVITPEAVSSWPKTSQILEKADIVEVSITGAMTVEQIIGILQETKNLQKLSFDNNFGALCAANKNANNLFSLIPECNTTLPKLRYLNFSSFDTCDTVVSMMLACLKMQPSQIEVHGNFNDESTQQFSELLKMYLPTLREIKINGNFDTQLSILPVGYQSQAKVIRIEIFNENFERGYGRIIVDTAFCSRFPLLSTIRIKGAFFDIDELLLFQKCKAVQEISFGIIMKRTDLRKIGHPYFHDIFPILSSLDLHLAFKSCPSPEILSDFVNEYRGFNSLTLCSNCIVSSNRNSKCHRKRLAQIVT